MEIQDLKTGNSLLEKIESLQRHIPDIEQYIEGIEINKKASLPDLPVLEIYWEGCEDDADYLRDDYFDVQIFLQAYVDACKVALHSLEVQFKAL